MVRFTALTRRPIVTVAAAGAFALGTYATLTVGFSSLAQDAAQTEDAPKAAPERKAAPRHAAPRAAPKVAAPAQTPAAAPAQAPAQTAAAPAASAITAKLKEAGAGACAAQVDALAAGVMGGVAQFNTVSAWAGTRGDQRPVSVTLGQSYGPGKAVPYAAASIFAAPNGQGGCDGMAVQVVPSPLPCAKLRESLSANGRQIGDLAGLPLMQDGGGQTLLVPTSANACVLIGLRTAYAQ